MGASYIAKQYCTHESIKNRWGWGEASVVECLLCKQEDLGLNLQHHVAGIAVQDAREARHVGMLAVEAAYWQPWRDSLGSLRVESTDGTSILRHCPGQAWTLVGALWLSLPWATYCASLTSSQGNEFSLVVQLDPSQWESSTLPFPTSIYMAETAQRRKVYLHS